MPTTTFTAHIRNLIAANKISEALQVLRELLADSPQLNRIVLQQKRFAEILAEKHEGTLKYEDAHVETNRISAGLLDLLSEIESETQQPLIEAEVNRFATQYVQKNVLNGNTITAGKNVVTGDGNTFHEHHYYDDPKIPRFLLGKPFQTDYFIGRDADLEAIEVDYQQNNRLLFLMNGEGGIGKTTLAAHYWIKHESRYHHLAWLFAERGVGAALTQLAQPLGVQFELHDNEAAQVARITAAMYQLKTPCLLVFDNANNATDLEKYFMVLKTLSNCHVLLTSRVLALEGATIHRVLPLEKNFAVQVFKKHYEKHADTEGSLLDALLHSVGYNTLVIEVLAKNLTVFNKFQNHYPLSALVVDLQSKGLLAVQNRPVKITYQADALRTETPENIIAAMYDLSDLSDTERYLLSNFAVLPAENIPFDVFMYLLKPADAAALEDPLSSLQQKGWIDYFETEGAFKISPVIQAITLVKNKERLYADAETLIETLIDSLHPDIFTKQNAHLFPIFANYGVSVIQSIDTPQYNVSVLCERVGTFYEMIGNLEKMLFFSENAIK